MVKDKIWKSGVLALVCAGVLGGCGGGSGPDGVWTAERKSLSNEGGQDAQGGAAGTADGQGSTVSGAGGTQGGMASGTDGGQGGTASGGGGGQGGTASGGGGGQGGMASGTDGGQGGTASGTDGGQGSARQGAGGSSGAGLPASGAQGAERAAYQAALKRLYSEKVFPDGSEHGAPDGEFSKMSDNRFAIYDIDFDGNEELIIEYTTTMTAGMIFGIYHFDGTANEVTEEYSFFPQVTFFDNGVVQENWSHNQGPGGEFWPYTLYRYDGEKDTYVQAESVEAWSREITETYEGNPFPKDADEDGDGVVYYIMKKVYEKGAPVDGAAYEQWRASYIGGAKAVEIPFLNLTEENIASVQSAANQSAAIPPASIQQQGAAAKAPSVPESAVPLQGQIKEQSFEVNLDGWGEVTFAPFEPEFLMKMDKNGTACYGDVRFMLLKDGKEIYTLPGIAVDNVWYGQRFGQVVSVAFRDYNEDGRKDILMILEYAGVQGSDIDVPFREVRAYTQAEGGKEFAADGLTSEYLSRNFVTESMEDVYRALEEYAKGYAAATSKSVWEVERYAAKVRDMILAGDYQGLSEEVAYPITIDGIVYKDREAFLAAPFVLMTNPEVLKELEWESCKNMFCSWNGVMFGDGCVWIGEVLDENLASKGLKVTALNGLTSGNG